MIVRDFKWLIMGVIKLLKLTCYDVFYGKIVSENHKVSKNKLNPKLFLFLKIR